MYLIYEEEVMTVDTLIGFVWIRQYVCIMDDEGNILFDGKCYTLINKEYKSLMEKSVDSIGTENGKLIIVVK